jgi:hypothetical protein
MSVKTTARQYGSRVVLMTHPKKGGRTGKGMDDMAGGSAYQRFTQSVLWLESLEEPKGMKVAPYQLPPEWKSVNRTIHIRKARNGRGVGHKIAFDFCGETMRFTELGVVIPEAKE